MKHAGLAARQTALQFRAQAQIQSGMIENWLKPSRIQFQQEQVSEGMEKFGQRISRYESDVPELDEVSLAIIGIGDKEADAVRRELYQTSFPFGTLKVADLGNARKAQGDFIIPLLQELMAGNICPVLIGQEDDLALSQFKAHNTFQPSVNLLCVQEAIPFHPKLETAAGCYLNSILNNKNQLFHFSVLGCQSHFVDEATFAELESRGFDCIRLGKARASLPELEPYIRDADLVSLHLSALKSTEAPGVAAPYPSGFFCEEACQISRYAGMSDKLSSIGFYGFKAEFDQRGQTAQVLAQMIWYFIDGFFNRKRDFPASMDDLVEYIVDIKGHDYQLTFWKSNKTGRWWLQVPVKTKQNLERHRLIPCSYNDYLLSLKGELPSRLFDAFKRFS